MARLIFMGSPAIAIPSLQALVNAGHELVAVVTQPDKPKGRGQKLAAPAVKLAAEALGLKVLQPASIKTKEFLQQVQNLQAQAIVVVAYGKVLPPEILTVTPWGAINLHFSLLPKYRGAACVAYALIQGDSVSGTTTMQMDPGLDTGPILMQTQETIRPQDTCATLSERLSQLGAVQLVETLQGLEANTLTPVPQQEDRASRAPLLKKTQGHVNFDQNATKLYNLYQGLSPWPGIFAFLNQKRILLTEIKIQDYHRSGVPGQLFIERERLLIQCNPGHLEVLYLKPEGKKVLSAAQFVRGLPQEKDLILT